MKKKSKPKSNDELRPHYDFSKAVRGKHSKQYAEGTNVVLLAPDVAKVFTNAETVNQVLRQLIDIAGKAASRS